MGTRTEELPITKFDKETAAHFSLYAPELRSGDRVLDVGIGPGLVSEQICRHIEEVEVCGLDVVDIRKNKSHPLTLYNGMRFPFESQSFDVSLIFNTLHHIKWPRLTLNEMLRVTKRRIIVIEEFRAHDCDPIADLRMEDEEHKDSGIFVSLPHSPLTMAELEAIFVDLGLPILTREELRTTSSRKIYKHLYILGCK